MIHPAQGIPSISKENDGLVQKIVDSNVLRTSGLNDYLCASSQHKAVLTDYAAMEAYKCEDLEPIYRSMEILSKFPKQVVILKSTTLVCGLKPRSARMPQRMIDAPQTRDFEIYCQYLADSRRGDEHLRQQLLDLNAEANAHMKRILADVSEIQSGFDSIAKTFSESELRILRTQTPFTRQIIEKIIGETMVLAAILFRDHPRVHRWPNARALTSTFVFRFSLCALMLAVNWITTGKRNVRPDRVRNDLVDVSFASYATYFDGILTEDKLVKELYLITQMILDQLVRSMS